VQAILALLGVIINFSVASKMLDTSITKMVNALKPALVSGAIMSVGVLITLYFTQTLNEWFQLIPAVAVGGLFYLAALWFLEREIVMKLFTTLRTSLLEK
ncbi:MAG: polysaccharide biosynthesis C-terminal domain-containing protein, partial [Anaerolineales bacterium]|nr:polysaccharide biosynthesis C-terminal domain-containing protein [Anaerolineales bacterium]